MPDNSSKQRTRRRFTEEFKLDAAALVLDTGRPIAHVATELGVYDSSLGNWVTAERRRRGQTEEDPTPNQLARLKELEAEVAELRIERDLLKRSVTFWVQETERHEAFVDRAVVKGHRLASRRSGSVKLGPARFSEREEGGKQPRQRREGPSAASSPDNDGMGQYCQMVQARQARREPQTSGNTPKEAIRALKRRLSDVVYRASIGR